MAANFTPDLKPYSNQGKFRYWVQMVLPTIYDDSLSYMELLNKVVYVINLAIEDVDTVEENVAALLESFNELQQFTNDYFDNLDVQEEINAKLDEMVSDGTFNQIINPIISEYFTNFSNRLNVLEARMDEFSNLPDGSTTGDAELQDIRIDYTGNTWPTAGDSVRSQARNLRDFENYLNKYGDILAYNVDEISGTRYKINYCSLPAGSYNINIENIESSDIDSNLSQIIFFNGLGEYILTLNLERNTPIKQKITLSDDIARIIYYAGQGATPSSGDTFTFTNVKITKALKREIDAQLTNTDTDILTSIVGGQFKVNNIVQGYLNAIYITPEIEVMNWVSETPNPSYCCTPCRQNMDNNAFNNFNFNITQPIYLNKGDVMTIENDLEIALYMVEPYYYENNLYYRRVDTFAWPTGVYEIERTGLYFLGRIRRQDLEPLTPEEAYESITIFKNNNIVKQIEDITNKPKLYELSKNPYTTDFNAFTEVLSTAHVHCETDQNLNKLAEIYDHVAISNYYPSAPWYPLSDFFETVPDNLLNTPNGEQAHFSNTRASVHISSFNSLLSRDTREFGGTIEDCIVEIEKQLPNSNLGGAIVNHPTYSQLTGDEIIDIMNLGKVIAIEIYNGNTEATTPLAGYSLTQWDHILSKGLQIYGTAAPDHEIEYHPNEERAGFGYNHLLVRALTEDECANAYCQGRFYTSIYNNDLKFINLKYVNNTFNVELSKSASIKFKTASREYIVNDSSFAFTTNNDDVYVRVEATDGYNTIYSNAIIL